jgi:hypothetical protein
MSENPQKSGYLGHLNWLRFFCIISIFLLHTGITFSFIPEIFPFWHIKSKHASVIITGFCAFSNSACMPLFFFLSGISSRFKIQTRDQSYYDRRIKKWITILSVSWPLVALSIGVSLKYIVSSPVKFTDILIPSFLNTDRITIPLNLFHLWYLFVLLLIESMMKFAFPHIINHFKFIFLVLLTCLQSGVILLQNQGYMSTPIFLNSLNLGSIIVYAGWYIAGFSLTSLNLTKLIDSRTLKHIITLRLFYIITISLFFIFKHHLINQVFDLLPLVYQLGISLFDSLLPWAVLCIWYDLMHQKIFYNLIANVKFLERFKNTVINFALEIYILQIPVIFFILSIWGKFAEHLIFFNTKNGPHSVNSIPSYSNWIILTVLTTVVIASIIGLKSKIKQRLLR